MESRARLGPDLVLATKPYAQEQRWRSWWHFFSTLAIVLGLFILNSLGSHWLYRLPVGILTGLVLVRVFVLYHDYLHGAILERSWFADVFFTVFGLLALSPRSIWKRSHDHHHHHNGQYFGTGAGTFKLMTVREFARAPRWRRLAYAFERHPLTILFGYLTVFLVGMCLLPFLMNPKRYWDAGFALVLHAAIIATLAIYTPAALFYAFLLPISIACAVGSYLFYAQHNFPSAEYHDCDHWDYVVAALRSSSCLRGGTLTHWFTGNIGYHHVHHLNSRIPFYRLPEAMAGIPELQSPGTTSLHPREIWRCLQLKLWDPDLKRLVGFRVTRTQVVTTVAQYRRAA
jgi:acyl-lipid omega-6 desaturase (Delta-12 desaturase)